ncbi:carboxypeptidase-like regulatory domain-containing protein [Polaribacter aestuariivivens]|uniref:carboxypeptidase-like regulatory domain-containing protein n=1 Tax=Polaribacter aestuariivivens TaxID=2304626 RepID=UPI003F495F97
MSNIMFSPDFFKIKNDTNNLFNLDFNDSFVGFNPDVKMELPFKTGGVKYVPEDLNFTTVDSVIPNFNPNLVFVSPPQKKTITISGVITDTEGNPIPNASVSVLNNTNNGTTTDFNGKYTLTVPEGEQLEVRYIGFKPEIFNANKSNINIFLEESINELDEVVVTAKLKKNNNLMYLGIGAGILALGSLLFLSKDKKTAKKVGLAAVDVTL